MSRLYISNGTMGEIWMGRNCYRCTKDHADHAEENYEEQCPVLMGLLCQEYPIEGLVEHKDRSWPDELECTYFTPCGCDS